MKKSSISLALIVGLTSIQLFADERSQDNPSASVMSERNACSASFAESAPRQNEPSLVWEDNKSFIQVLKYSESFGAVRTFYSEKYQTQFYHTNSGRVDSKGNVPLVDPSCKGVYIFFHGSGTMKSSGRNFTANMNLLNKFGYCGVAFDMPFHSSGPRSEDFMNIDYTLKWLRSIVEEIKQSRKRVILAGHSFGPMVILELATRFPKLVNDVVPLSIGGFDEVTERWETEVTDKMLFGGDVAENIPGGLFAGAFGQQSLWNKQKLPDPTLINKNLRIRFLSGDREEYFPAPLTADLKVAGPNTYDISVPLKKWFKNATVTIEPGVGHYIFDHVDSTGTNVVLRELLLASDVSPSQYKELMDAVKKDRDNDSDLEKAAKRYTQDLFFRDYADRSVGRENFVRMLANHQERVVLKIYNQFLLDYKKREGEIFSEIMRLKGSEHLLPSPLSEMVKRADPKRTDRALFYPYLAYIESLN